MKSFFPRRPPSEPLPTGASIRVVRGTIILDGILTGNQEADELIEAINVLRMVLWPARTPQNTSGETEG